MYVIRNRRHKLLSEVRDQEGSGLLLHLPEGKIWASVDAYLSYLSLLLTRLLGLGEGTGD